MNINANKNYICTCPCEVHDRATPLKCDIGDIFTVRRVEIGADEKVEVVVSGWVEAGDLIAESEGEHNIPLEMFKVCFKFED